MSKNKSRKQLSNSFIHVIGNNDEFEINTKELIDLTWRAIINMEEEWSLCEDGGDKRGMEFLSNKMNHAVKLRKFLMKRGLYLFEITDKNK